jgi:tryptophanyl-tRNA synthetase
MIKHVIADLAPHRERRAELAAKKGYVREVLAAGDERARQIARRTMEEVRAALGLRGA